MNMILILSISHLPMRAEPNHRAAMVSEWLFGETCRVLEQKQTWYYLQNTFDNYCGWVELKPLLYHSLSDSEHENWQKERCFTTNYLTQIQQDKARHYLSLGSYISQFRSFKFGKIQFKYDEPISPPQALPTLAKLYLNVPYLWGGRSVFGIDCSGFVQQVFKYFDIFLPRDAHQQAAALDQTIQPEAAQLGDLMFCQNEQGRIDHVALALDSEEVIHASGAVQISKWNRDGILEADGRQLSHRAIFLKRLPRPNRSTFAERRRGDV